MDIVKDTTPALLDAQNEIEERILAIMGGKPLPEDSDVNDMTEEQKREFVDLLKKRQKEYFEGLTDKPDSTYFWVQKKKAEMVHLQEEISKLQAQKKAIANGIDSFMEFLGYKLDSLDIPIIQGKTKRFYIRETTDIKPKDVEITSSLYMKMTRGRKKPLIKREYSWKVRDFQAAYKADPEGLKDFAVV